MRNVAIVMLSLLAPLASVGAGSTLDATVATANNTFVPDLVRGDAVQAASPFAPDAIFIVGNNKVVRGRAAIVEMLRERLQKVKFVGGTCSTKTLERTESTAWETGSCVYTTEVNGRKRTSGGRFMTVWKRSSAGEWLIEVNVAV